MPNLFSPLRLRTLTISNRIWVSPMCQYSAQEGMANDWHLVHLGSRAVGGAGLVMVEATGVSPEARISPADLGLWSDAHTEAFKPITRFIKAHGAAAGIQLAHAGRKASTYEPWLGIGALPSHDPRAWQSVAPSAIPFHPKDPIPHALTHDGIKGIIRNFENATRRALDAGFQLVEIHAAHGYLFHEFLSPLSNQRSDIYGGSLENRMRLLLEVAQAVRQAWPQELPVFVRISATDWVKDGWDIDQSVILASKLKVIGIDLIDASSGGVVPHAEIPVGPSYQLPFAEAIRAKAGIMTAAVGMITEAHQANAIIAEGKADGVFLARELLRNPYWPMHAAHKLGASITWPNQYLRAKP